MWTAILVATVVVSALVGAAIGTWQRSRHGRVAPTASQRTAQGPLAALFAAGASILMVLAVLAFMSGPAALGVVLVLIDGMVVFTGLCLVNRRTS
jgi:hypothetical protein